MNISNNNMTKINKSLNSNINNNSAIIYCRVSTARQKYGSSLDSQQTLCNDYCNLMKFNNISSVSEICSATSMTHQKKLNNLLINFSNINLVVLEPSRLCRNIKDFVILLDTCNKKNITIHFVKNNITSNNTQDIKKMISCVYDAETESKTLSDRIKTSIMYRKRMKTYLPSNPSFGYIIKDKKLYCNELEQDVITLINKLFWGSNANSINSLLFKLTNCNEEICDMYNNDEIYEVEHGNMRIIDIVYFLNKLDIKFRGKNWNSNSISKLIKGKKILV